MYVLTAFCNWFIHYIGTFDEVTKLDVGKSLLGYES